MLVFVSCSGALKQKGGHGRPPQVLWEPDAAVKCRTDLCPGSASGGKKTD